MQERTQELAGGNRYGIVFVVALAAVVFLVVTPESSWTDAIGLLLAGATLLVVIATSRGNERLRQHVGVALIAALVAVAVALGLELIPQGLGALASAVLVQVTLVQLLRGLAVMLRVRGVTVQAVLGALAVYLLLGIVFASVISAVAKLGHGPYFAQGTDGSESQRVYFSFTTMTTTGFGDLSPASGGGRAIAVLEMLTGQIYLVTVISLLVGNLSRRRRDL